MPMFAGEISGSLDSLTRRSHRRSASPVPTDRRLQTSEPIAAMDEQEFRRILGLFPVVRSRDYCAGSELPRQHSTSHSARDELTEWQDAWTEEDKKGSEIQGVDIEDPFWKKLKLAAERKVGAAEAEKFCKVFQMVHRKLVYEELSLDVAQKFNIQ
ncbi:hypothetical protein NE237_010808 [Protea cynaroides]|uniref:Uncharacterized protein n=1 Tax=Protea cynaroides TaxID=273540 RepID=A0A9Q0L084_9MAGN|nr:hypothetical protein NE237_010808 [Protea cynaroides]